MAYPLRLPPAYRFCDEVHDHERHLCTVRVTLTVPCFCEGLETTHTHTVQYVPTKADTRTENEEIITCAHIYNPSRFCAFDSSLSSSSQHLPLVHPAVSSSPFGTYSPPLFLNLLLSPLHNFLHMPPIHRQLPLPTPHKFLVLYVEATMLLPHLCANQTTLW